MRGQFLQIDRVIGKSTAVNISLKESSRLCAGMCETVANFPRVDNGRLQKEINDGKYFKYAAGIPNL